MKAKHAEYYGRGLTCLDADLLAEQLTVHTDKRDRLTALVRELQSQLAEELHFLRLIDKEVRSRKAREAK